MGVVARSASTHVADFFFFLSRARARRSGSGSCDAPRRDEARPRRWPSSTSPTTRRRACIRSRGKCQGHSPPTRWTRIDLREEVKWRALHHRGFSLFQRTEAKASRNRRKEAKEPRRRPRRPPLRLARPNRREGPLLRRNRRKNPRRSRKRSQRKNLTRPT